MPKGVEVRVLFQGPIKVIFKMSNSRSKFLCLDCQVDTGKIYEHYFINTDTWMSVVGSKTGMLCISCIEQRLKRKLVASDFPDVTINNPKYAKMSLRLLDRINHNARVV